MYRHVLPPNKSRFTVAALLQSADERGKCAHTSQRVTKSFLKVDIISGGRTYLDDLTLKYIARMHLAQNIRL